MAPPNRTLLTRSRGLAGQLRVYDTRDALECEEFEQGEITRWRVFYDDVQLVTLHRSPGALFAGAAGALAALFSWLGFKLGQQEGLRAGLVLFGLTGLPCLLAMLLRLLLGAHTLTVYGRRTKARIRFGVRRARAREAFDRICRLVAEGQQRARTAAS